MEAFLKLPAARRLLAFQQVDEAMDLQDVSVQKDLCVYWIFKVTQ